MKCTKCGNEVIWFSHNKLTHGRNTPFKQRFHQPKVKELTSANRPKN